MEELSMDYVAPLLRLVRAASLEEDIRLLVSQAARLDQFLQAVKGTRLAARAGRLESVDDVEAAAWSYALELLSKLKPLERILPRTYAAYVMVAAESWLLRILRAGLAGAEAPREVPRIPLIQRLARTVQEAGVRATSRLLAQHGFEALAETVRSPRLDQRAIELAADVDLVRALAAAVEEARDSIGYEHACYRLDAVALRTVGSALMYSDREVQRMVRDRIETCLLNRQRLVDALEEGSTDRLVAALHGTPYPYSASPRLGPVEAAYHAIRRYSRAKLARSLAYDPTEPGHAVAVLELLVLDVEDVVALATAAFAGLPRETVQEIVTVSG